MNELIPGLIVERAISEDVLAGVFEGRYRVHGGVIRCAPGTDCAGQIVRHLMPVGEFNTNVLTTGIGTNRILAAAAATMSVAGLNLVVTAVGFLALQKKLERVDRRPWM
jgi:hypothetical protein